MKKNKVLNVVATLLILIILIGGSYAFFAYSKKGVTNSKVVSGNIYMYYNDTNELSISNVFPQTKEEGILNDYFEFEVKGKNTANNKDIYYAINLVYGNEDTIRKRFHDEDIVFYLTEVVNGEEIVLIDSVQYKNINDAKIYVETIPNNTKDEIKHVYRLRAWIDEDVLISDSSLDANYTTGEYKNSYASIKINVSGNLKENDINMVLDANDDNYVNGKRAIYVDTYGYKDDNLVLEVTSDSSNIGFMYEDEKGNSSTDIVDTLTLNYKSYNKEIIVTKVIPVAKNDANTKTKLLFKLIRNGEVVEQQVKSLTVYGNNFCLNNGFNKLSDCLLVSEKMSNSVSDAKTFITNKGTPDFSKTAPIMKYAQKVEEDVTTPYSTTRQFYVSKGFIFDENDGDYTLATPNNIVSLDEEGTYNGYFTCGDTDYGYSNCSTVYQIGEVVIDDNTTTLTKYNKYTYVETEVLGESDVGLYKTNDDDGETFYYRGAVTNNNVKFAGFDWKIIRINGDGSIRLIKNTNIGSSQYNSKKEDPTYVGYTYNKNYSNEETTSSEVNFTDINVGPSYYVGKKENCKYNEETKLYSLVATDSSPLITGTVSEIAIEANITNGYVYTCFATTENGSCEVLKQISNVYVTNTIYIPVKYISRSSTSYMETIGNDYDSSIKISLDNWYKNNLTTHAQYLEDTTYCNDRSMPYKAFSSGYKIDENTYYGAVVRNYQNKTPSLMCQNKNDRYTVDVDDGNKWLDYPIGLITSDELMMAGGVMSLNNTLYYLNNNASFWTESPGNYSAPYNNSSVWCVRDSGVIDYANVLSNFGVRPVINLKANVLISSGDGTENNPYELKLS